MATYALKANIREALGKKNEALRENGLIPSVLYGHGIKNQNLSVKRNDFLKIYQTAGTSSLIDLQIDETKPVKTLIHDIQSDPKSSEIIHIDFYQIKENEKITTEVELEFIGEAPAVKELGGILVKNYDEIEIECFPKDLELIDTIKVDLSVLKTFNDAIHIKDLKVPAEIKIMVSPDEVVALVTEPEEEKIEVPVAEVPAEPELAEKKGKESEEGGAPVEKAEAEKIEKADKTAEKK